MKIKRKFKYVKGAVPSIKDALKDPNEYTPPEAPDKGIEPNADFDDPPF